MILTRRSLLFSLGLHCSLVVGGFFLYQALSDGGLAVRLEGEKGRLVVTRPVEIRSVPEPPQPVRQASIDPPTTSPSRPSSSRPQDRETSDAEHSEQSRPKERPSSAPATKPDVALPTRPTYPQARPRPPSRTSLPASGSTRTADPEPQPTPTETAEPELGWGVVANEESPGAGEGGTQSAVTRRATPTARPEFALTERFPDLDSVSVKAQFVIEADGSFEPTLLTSTGNPTADVVILGKLLEYEWLPAMEKGVPQRDTRVIDIDLEG